MSMNDYQKPYTFRAGTYAKSSEVNANFDTIKDYVNELKDYAEDIEIGSAPYNKANLEGNQYVNFSVAASRSGHSNDAVNRGELESVQSDINTLAGRVTTLEGNTAPTYNNGTLISPNTTITSAGVIIITSSGSAPRYVFVDNTMISLGEDQTLALPVKNGTVIGTTNHTNIMLYV